MILVCVLASTACGSNAAVCNKANELREKAGETERTSTMVGQKAVNKCMDDLAKEEKDHPAATECRKRCILSASTLSDANTCGNGC
jgi:hypothetical protein